MTGGPDGPRWAEVEACTLPTAERPLRLAEFGDLFATSLSSIDRRTATHVRLLLAGEDGLVERTQQLADAESACCSFFTFTVTPLDHDQVAFDIVVPFAYADVLAALVDRAETALAGPR